MGKDQEELVSEHLYHQSPGVVPVIQGALEEGYDGIRRAVQSHDEEVGFEDIEDAYGAAIAGYDLIARLVAYRMFLIGLELGRGLSIEDLAPCEHLEVPDDELDTFLQVAMNLKEGGETK